MGEVVGKDAAVEVIEKDVRDSLERARAKGGAWKAHAEAKLVPVVALMDLVGGREREAAAKFRPLYAALLAADDRADARMGAVYDEVWNALDRPASDAVLSLVFGGGAMQLVESDVEGQPDRMEMVADLLESGLHPRLPRELAAKAAAALRDEAGALRAAVDAVRGPRARAEVLGRARTAVVRAARVELVNLKRLYKAEGFSEAAIHEIIPDRPRERGPAPVPPL